MITLYAFEGQQPCDLAFQRNEVLEIIGKRQEEWWEARNALGATGLVPANYLVRICYRISVVKSSVDATIMHNELPKIVLKRMYPYFLTILTY